MLRTTGRMPGHIRPPLGHDLKVSGARMHHRECTGQLVEQR